MSDQDQLPHASPSAPGIPDVSGSPDPATDPVTGPVFARLERFSAATTIEAPADLAAGIRARLALEPRPAAGRPAAGLSAWAPRDIVVALRRNTDEALGRARVPLLVRLQAVAVIAVLVLAVGAAGIAGAWLLRSVTDHTLVPAASPTVPVVSPSPSGDVPTFTPEPSKHPASTPGMSATRRSTRGDGRSDVSSGRVARSTGLAAESSPSGRGGKPTAEPVASATSEPGIAAEPTLEPTAEPTAEPTLEPTAEPTLEPRPDPTPRPARTPRTHPVPDPTSDPTPVPTEPAPEPTPGESPAPAPSPAG